MKPWNAAKAKKLLDALWSEKVKARDRYCRFCGRVEGVMNSHHIFSRRHTATRWDLRNGVQVCFTCHSTAHRDIPFGHEKAVEAIGMPLWLELKRKSQAICRFDRAMFEATKAEFEKSL